MYIFITYRASIYIYFVDNICLAIVVSAHVVWDGFAFCCSFDDIFHDVMEKDVLRNLLNNLRNIRCIIFFVKPQHQHQHYHHDYHRHHHQHIITIIIILVISSIKIIVIIIIINYPWWDRVLELFVFILVEMIIVRSKGKYKLFSQLFIFLPILS